ncbi:hypothetical protein IHE44_0011047, partial [Lamprotornis superbus]
MVILSGSDQLHYLKKIGLCFKRGEMRMLLCTSQAKASQDLLWKSNNGEAFLLEDDVPWEPKISVFIQNQTQNQREKPQETCKSQHFMKVPAYLVYNQHYFTVLFGHEGQKPLELRCEDEVDGDEWVEAIHQARVNLIVALNKTKEKMRPYQGNQDDEDPDIKKIKKVQSFMRGWLCRRKWKTIVQDYICSPHAESMRKRNQIVFNMVEAESEYVHQLYVLVNCFLRPLRMAASSKKPPISHDDVSSIFLNSETIMFLHEIFHQGLKARIANWPTLILADLFDILLPMLNIYQEFVRNHQYSLQVLANCKQNRDFDKLLKQYEANPACEGRMLETFLTYPMFQIPRYIITLHELLAHTPHEHVERKSLEFAKSKLEELSRVMHDEVSDTENIRKNLAIERTIVEGCDILLDTSQTFIRQGSLIQVPSVERGKLSKVRLGSLSLKKEGERQCFLFTKHFLICTRSSGGKLHLLKTGGVLSLIECTLVEETEASDDDSKGSGQVFGHLDFKLVVEPTDAPPFTVVLLAPSRQEKAAWTSDISQCIDNIRCNGLMTIVFEENSKVTVPHMIKSLELFFATSQNSRGEYLADGKSPHLCRKFSSPPPLSLSRTSSPARTRKLSLTSPLNSRIGALDLSASSVASSPTSSYSPATSPPPTGSKAPLDLSRGLSSPEQSPGSAEDSLENPRLDLCNKLRRSIRRGIPCPRTAAARPVLAAAAVLESVSVDRTIPESTSVVDTAELSPCRSPSTPRHLRYRQPGVQTADNSHCSVSPASAFAIATAAAGHGSPPVPFLTRTRGTNWSNGRREPVPSDGRELRPRERGEGMRRLLLLLPGFSSAERTCDKEFIIRRAATNRVLNVLRHWVSKHSQDFELNNELKMNVLNLLEEVLRDPDLLPQERKATANILRLNINEIEGYADVKMTLSQDDQDDNHLKIEDIIQMPDCPKPECFETLSAMELAEQITLLDHVVFRSIPYEEFLGQGWMKVDKNERTPYIMKTSQHFNDMSNLVASQIMSYADAPSRASAIEKWVAVADICRCLHNYNGVLEITSALNRSAIYRLKKTWAKVSKQVRGTRAFGVLAERFWVPLLALPRAWDRTPLSWDYFCLSTPWDWHFLTKALMDKLQKTVSSEGRFKNLREMLKNCNPPAVPYLGMYLTDLAFIEEGTPNFTEEGLVNFSKMRM